MRKLLGPAGNFMSAGCVLSSTDFAGSTNRPGTAEPYQWLYPKTRIQQDEENTESTTDEPEEETDPNMERIVDFQNLQQINPEDFGMDHSSRNTH